MIEKKLEYFLELCEIGNMTITAEKVHLTRQALSNCIRSLEQDLGTDLFVRSKTGVTLTQAGQLLKEYAEQQSLLWDELILKIRHEKSRHLIRFGSHLMHLNASDIHSLIAYQKIEPSIHISFHDDEDYSAHFHLLRKNELDVAVTRKAPEHADLAAIKASDCKIGVVLSQNSPLSKLDKVDFYKDIKGQTYFTVSQDTLNEIEPFLKKFGAHGEFVNPSQTLISELIELGSGVFATPQRLAHCLVTDNMVMKELVNFPIHVALYIVFRPNPPEFLSKFINHLLTIFGE